MFDANDFEVATSRELREIKKQLKHVVSILVRMEAVHILFCAIKVLASLCRHSI